ncbi:MAG TPA: hypothetical protein VEP68_09470 [Anaeromyxobacteraceae bacterium]|nr:hypothetical protein [Anaeromyxobacteraceae bacterium]
MSDPFAPLLVPPVGSTAATGRLAAEIGAGPLLARDLPPPPGDLAARALALVPAWQAEAPEEACRAADGSPAVGEAALACPVSQAARDRLAARLEAAMGAGFAGVALDRPDAALLPGLLGAGFCQPCQRAFHQELAREYGDQLEPFDAQGLAREALAQASGALGLDALPFGREFWRFRADSVTRSVAAAARAARDWARSAGRAAQVSARFSSVGPAQAAAAHHLDSAIFPTSEPDGLGAGAFRLLRAVMGRRPCAAELPAGTAAEAAWRSACLAAACGVDVLPPDEAAARALAPLRRLARELGLRRGAPGPHRPVMECAVLYSAESDLWSDGRHRAAVAGALDALAAAQVQAAAVADPADAPPKAVLVLAGADGLSPHEAHLVLRRVESGGGLLAFGHPVALDHGGRPAPQPFLPEGKPAGVRVGQGTLVELPDLVPPPGSGLAPGPPDPEALARALQLLLGRGVRAASTLARSPLYVSLYQEGEAVDVHLVSLEERPVRGATLFLGVHVVGSRRRARFRSADGVDERITVNPSGYSISTVLPAFRGWAVVSLPD